MMGKRRARVLAIACLGLAGTPGLSAAGPDLVDILPDLVPAFITAPSGTASTNRATFGGGPNTIDTGPAFGAFDTSEDLGNIASSAFQDFQNLPVGSAVAAFTYVFDPEQNVFKPSEQGLGPIFADRAQTLGKGKLNIGVTWAHVDFDEIEGTNLNRIPIPTNPFLVTGETFSDPATNPGNPTNPNDSSIFTLFAPGVTSASFVFPNDDVGGAATCSQALFQVCSVDLGFPSFVVGSGPDGQYTTTVNTDPDLNANVHLEVDLINLYASFGVTEKFDVGILLPVLEVDLDAEVFFETFNFADPQLQQGLSDAMALIGCTPDQAICQQAALLLTTAGIRDQAVNVTGTDPGAAVNTYLRSVTFSQSFKDHGTSQGVGDLMIRGKYRFLESEYLDAAGRLDIAFPTGDEDNFRGTGEYMFGFNLIMSKTIGWFSPHANLAIQVRTGGKENDQFRWLVGADARIHERVAASVDFVGNEDLYHDDIGDTQMAIAPGIKVNPWKNLVVSGAAVIRVNHQGLRADVIPTLNVEYTFF